LGLSYTLNLSTGKTPSIWGKAASEVISGRTNLWGNFEKLWYGFSQLKEKAVAKILP
jgi:hypothetical protein